MSTQGLLTLEALRQHVQDESIETVIVAFTDHYGRLMGKRLDAEFFLETAAEGTHACDYLLTTDMEMEPVQGYESANWELGYGDFHLVPDLATLRIADWLEKTALVLCDLTNNGNDKNIKEAPRSILKSQIEALAVLGFTTAAASELEYYLFKTSYEEAHDSRFVNPKPAGWYIEDYHILQGSRTEKFTAAARKHLKKSGIPVENSKGEWGLGQHELNVRYAPTLDMADRHVVYKQCLKELADEMGLSVSFMAKYASDRAGSGCHIHVSLWQGHQNAFVGDEHWGRIHCSRTFKFFLGGWLKYVPDVMVFYAPTINSYKRYTDGSWAPTRIACSVDNRTAGFRVVGRGKSLRIECRIPGADCNPYLAFAAALASGMQGIKDKTEPPACFEGDMYAARHLPHVPGNLRESVDLFAESDFAKQAFGEKVVKHCAHFYHQEIAAFERAVTDWERKRYFERI